MQESLYNAEAVASERHGYMREVGYDKEFVMIMGEMPELEGEFKQAMNQLFAMIDSGSIQSDTIQTEHMQIRLIGAKDSVQQVFVEDLSVVTGDKKVFKNFYCQLTLEGKGSYFVKIYRDKATDEDGDLVDTYREGGEREVQGSKIAEKIIEGNERLAKRFQVIPVHLGYDFAYKKADTAMKFTVSRMAQDFAGAQADLAGLDDYMDELKAQDSEATRQQLDVIEQDLVYLQNELNNSEEYEGVFWDDGKGKREGDAGLPGSYPPNNAFIDRKTGIVYLYDLGVRRFTD